MQKHEYYSMTRSKKKKKNIKTLILPLAALLEHGLFGIDIERRAPLQLQIHPKLQTQKSCNQPSTNLMPFKNKTTNKNKTKMGKTNNN